MRREKGRRGKVGGRQAASECHARSSTAAPAVVASLKPSLCMYRLCYTRLTTSLKAPHPSPLSGHCATVGRGNVQVPSRLLTINT